jgi:hypothetical protein
LVVWLQLQQVRLWLRMLVCHQCQCCHWKAGSSRGGQCPSPA